LLIFDGDCHFCRRWIERWRELTRDAFEYAPFQEVADRFREIPREHFEQAVHFIDADGSVYRGAQAVFRSLGTRAKISNWCYEHVPGFASVTEAAYAFIARRRRLASFFTGLFWGNDVRPSTYFTARDLFVRALSAIYLIAFVSLWLQIDGLIGEQGILPVGQHLQLVREQLGLDAFFLLPTLCWFGSSNTFLHFLCGAGAVLSILLMSGDDSWLNLTALDCHYWTQPLPTVIGWWADQHAEWFKKFSVGFCLVVEIVVPFFIWAPRGLRHIAAGLLIFLQLAIAATGNYCFFNLLTIALCLLLFDDTILRRTASRDDGNRDPLHPRGLPVLSALIITLPINAMLIFSAFKPHATWPWPIATVAGYLDSFHVVNGYGLFRVMTKTRPEIIIEGSADGVEWLPYEFHWKPGALDKPPAWAAPHQPRLDWQMWFAALGTYRHNPWFVSLLERLLRNTPEVTWLLAHNPFPETPPRYVRARLFEYRFANWEQHRATGAWWT